MSDTDSWADGPYLPTTDESLAMHNRIAQLEGHLRRQQIRVNELEYHLARTREEEELRRGILEVEIDCHKEALVKKSEEVKEREGTIEELNCLLGLAWADFQSQTSSRRETEKAMVMLKDYVEDMLATTEPERTANKKRRLGS